MSEVELRQQRFDELEKIILNILPISIKKISDFLEEKRKSFPLNVDIDLFYANEFYSIIGLIRADVDDFFDDVSGYYDDKGELVVGKGREGFENGFKFFNRSHELYISFKVCERVLNYFQNGNNQLFGISE